MWSRDVEGKTRTLDRITWRSTEQIVS